MSAMTVWDEAEWRRRIAAGLCGNCEAPRVTATSCRPCDHKHYCRPYACVCETPAADLAYRSEVERRLARESGK